MTGYDFDYSEDSPYGCVVKLIEAQGRREGLILDLGCGFGSVAEPLTALSFTYAGCDISSGGLDSLRDRGFETHRLDLADVDSLGERLVKISDGRPVSAILLLDALEHLPDPEAFLEALSACSLDLDRPLLGLSVPNIGHFDVGAKLAAGIWDVTQSGLLDRTHLQFFNERRLTDVLGDAGWFEVARRDFHLHHSDQHFPGDHPVLADGTPLRDLLWRLRRRMGEDQSVNQFVRLFTLVSVDHPRSPATQSAQPFLSVLVRTVGDRPSNLVEALTCLAAQTDDDLEVVLLVHSARQEVFTEVFELVEMFAPQFKTRVHIHRVPDGGRARPLNVGLVEARGRYVAFLDDDDLVTADWAERFRVGAKAAPGRIVRSITADRWVSRNDDEQIQAPYVTLSGLEMAHAADFDILEHFSRNRTPICSFAVPTEAVRALGVGFDEEAAVLEDWYFLLQLALPCGVHDTGFVTSVYHRWKSADSSLARIDRAVWDTTRASVLQRLDAGPLLLPPGSTSRLAGIWEQLLDRDHKTAAARQECEAVRLQLDHACAALEDMCRAAADEAAAAAAARAAADEARASAEEILASTAWRASFPLRWIAQRIRKA